MDIAGYGPTGGPFPGQPITNWIADDAWEDGFDYAYRDWEIHPNPYAEQITFGWTDGAAVSQVVIDTICIPLPAALPAGLVIIAGLGAVSRLRRRRAAA